jgi:6-phosphogluconolactonase (cycloisomerase 2 family)
MACIAYTTNTGSGTVSSYTVDFYGNLALLNSMATNTGSASSPFDEAISNDSRYFYVLTLGTKHIRGFAIGIDGSLTPLSLHPPASSSGTGLVAR